MPKDNYFSVNYNDPYCKYEEDMEELKFSFDCKTETKAGLYKGSAGMNYCNYIIRESEYGQSKKLEIPTRFEKLVESSVVNNDKRDLILTKHGIILKSRRNGGFYDLLKEFKRGGKLTKEEFILKANQIHGFKYSYLKTTYKNSRTKICITCPVHGDLEQVASSHLTGRCCNDCIRFNRRDCCS